MTLDIQPITPRETTASRTLDPAEVERFRRMADEWWDAKGKFRPLHKLGPARLTFIRDEIVRHFGSGERASGAERSGERASGAQRSGERASAAKQSGGLKPLAGLRVLDIGCGGGLVSEPVSRMGAQVTGLDPGEENILAARAHAEPQGLAIDYRIGLVEDLAAADETFDAVLCLEVVEHVPDVGAFVKTCANLVRPGGVMILSTINRNIKSYALAIVAAEYVLGWLPRGTHQWERFVTPDELSRTVMDAGLTRPRFSGMAFDPLRDTWSLSSDTDVNYLAAAGK